MAALPLAHQPFFPREGQRFSSPGHTQITQNSVALHATMLSKVEGESPENKNIIQILIFKKKIRNATMCSFPYMKDHCSTILRYSIIHL